MQNHRFFKIWVMFCRFRLGPQDSLLTQVFLPSSTRCHFTERRGGGGLGVFSLRLDCEHLINVNNCCHGRCYEKSRILLIRFLKDVRAKTFCPTDFFQTLAMVLMGLTGLRDSHVRVLALVKVLPSRVYLSRNALS